MIFSRIKPLKNEWERVRGSRGVLGGKCEGKGESAPPYGEILAAENLKLPEAQEGLKKDLGKQEQKGLVKVRCHRDYSGGFTSGKRRQESRKD